MTEDILQARRIGAAEAGRAYQLVAMFHPDISKAQWTRYLRSFSAKDGRRGLVVLEDARGCIHAIFAFAVQRSLRDEATLQISELATARLPGSVPMRAMMRFAGKLAAELGLPAVLLDLEPVSVATFDDRSLARAGYALDRVTLRACPRS
ncbi:MAG: hypothetical protein J0J10_07920 [Bosea sp.]|uniref:hypothetical protein n=1 Tax=Bosea sp. (in: a-proteobacteria) TaxID=1871050 RepID=UPI001AD178BA|nr:hypothetical protein [Bosea sp. (in: a-proteobacteria)]MBN9468682.1 hypothetical protein [Bosea sp. (in: a-proteobacteria)]